MAALMLSRRRIDALADPVYGPKVAAAISMHDYPMPDGRIGMVAKAVEGTKGCALRVSCGMSADDFYVRARIEEDGSPLCTAVLHPQDKSMTWTHPYMNRQGNA